MVETPETIFWVTRKMVSAFKKIFSFAQTIVWVIQTVFTMTSTTVAAAQKKRVGEEKVKSYFLF